MEEYALSAADILADIHCEPLQNFSATVRRETSQAGATHMSALDAHLSSVNSRRTSLTWPLNRGDVIEVQGPAASGKTQFIYYMVTNCLLPSSHCDRELGGWGKAVVLFDTDGKFSISRLYDLLRSRLRILLETEGDMFDSDISLEDLATQCLANLHVFKPTSSTQLAITLLYLPTYHARDERLRDKEIGLLAIDSMSAFYWRDRYSLEQLRDAADSSAQAVLPPNPTYYVLKALQRIRLSHRPVILMSNWGLNPLVQEPASGEPPPLFYRQHLHPFPAPFEPHGVAHAMFNLGSSQQPSGGSDDLPANPPGRGSLDSLHADLTLPLHYHITLHRSQIDPFPASYTLADVIAQEHMRAEVVCRGEIRGAVRTPGDEDVGEFTFCIGAMEVAADPIEGALPSASVRVV